MLNWMLTVEISNVIVVSKSKLILLVELIWSLNLIGYCLVAFVPCTLSLSLNCRIVHVAPGVLVGYDTDLCKRTPNKINQYTLSH